MRGQIFHMDDTESAVVQWFSWLKEKNREGSGLFNIYVCLEKRKSREVLNIFYLLWLASFIPNKLSFWNPGWSGLCYKMTLRIRALQCRYVLYAYTNICSQSHLLETHCSSLQLHLFSNPWMHVTSLSKEPEKSRDLQMFFYSHQPNLMCKAVMASWYEALENSTFFCLWMVFILYIKRTIRIS